MNESHQKYCIACLKSEENVVAMSYNDINYYQAFIAKIPTQTYTFICVFCRQVLKKFMKFIHQCHAANNYLHKNYGKLDFELTTPPIQTSYNLIKSNTTTHILGFDEDLDIKPIISQDQEDSFIDEFECRSEDELPLSVLSKTNGEKEFVETKTVKKKRKKVVRNGKEIKYKTAKRNNENSETATKNKRKKWTTAKGVEKEGFSSKMVQETDEYWVIKLTKEQVLQEMKERSTSDKYLKYIYRCEQCVKGFNFDDVLQNHLQKHTQKAGTFECDICHQFCPSAVSLRGHMKSHTTRYKCKVCEEVRLSRQHLLEHHSIAHGGGAKTYTCLQCHYTTDKRTVIQRHVRSHKSDRHTCHRCGNSYSTLMALRVHLQRHESSRLSCPHCDRKFVSTSLLRSHISSVHERADFYCVECDVKFQCAYNLNLHYRRARRHRDDSSYKYKCTSCPQRFVYPSGAASHAASHSNNSIQCDKCHKKYSSKHALKTHCRRSHAQTKQSDEA